MAKSIQEWLHEGEQLYEAAMKEYQQLEAQLDEMEHRLAAKQAEVNQIAAVIGKPPVEGNHRLAAQIIDHEPVPSNTSSIIARALTGKQINR